MKLTKKQQIKNILKHKFFPLLFFSIFCTLYCRNSDFQKSSAMKAFKEINESFHYNKKPIHPVLIEKFIPGMLPGYWHPKVSAVDLLNIDHTNQFFDKFEFSQENTTFRCHVHIGTMLNEEYYAYTWLGKLDNDVHVVFTEESGGGTITSYWLHFFKVCLAEAYTPEGKKFYQILLTFVRNYHIGGEDDTGKPNINILKKSVKITFSNGSIETLEFNE